MDISFIIALMGGLALFLYGMKMMSDGLELCAGDRLQSILERLTSNRLMGVVVGALITALIQSSSATTVMTVGFVNAGLMTLPQAVGVIMGANIGTTITGQLIALDIGAAAPAIALIGVVMVVFLKKERTNAVGMIIGGLGILFIGMGMMSDAMAPLRDNAAFLSLITAFNNPVIAVLTGAVFTAVIQSSSASIGILQTLANNGLITLQHSVFILFGMNIGTCITAVLSSLSSSRNAKRVALVHLLFNVGGALLFSGAVLLLPLTAWIAQFTPANPAAQIANFHTLFNVVTTLILLPLGSGLAALAVKLLPEEKEAVKPVIEITRIPEQRLGNVTISLHEISELLNRMYHLVQSSLNEAFCGLTTLEWDKEKILAQESEIDTIHRTIIDAIPVVATARMNVEDSRRLNVLFKINNDLERMGDHVVNLSEHASQILKEKQKITPQASRELAELQTILNQTAALLPTLEEYHHADTLQHIDQLEEQMDQCCEKSRQDQIQRLRNQQIDGSLCVVFSEVLTDLERIHDHYHNLAQQLYHEELTAS
ncbi:Na/Pi cotransporter family protein [Holdemania massiliensis]|uniref:Na/Pi cotransporter family protein n=2 Tax=Holdemania massiliensis TaxID=1468449 RepID=A0A6N7S342_9FIRM|nr:Na/Pi cotransporter family protein [Holdemania massiliensis]MSA72675.1 Na/Pi cotransporter family protein [Holdemania massiliensis]MSA88065.1 Na/Pi cotransporter family protein [Holdemania massiliensis]MSB79760.1 Na/Pi cotransporter family protein [Holdemania massiliensis]MSC34681.1 Na/Pi cotransporter family protein [Holdemania massiliensis]MSC41070.1 Na/Pi cotransporter family protein [Holdemania massiliensis]